MKAYKGYNQDLTCRDFQYEIGKTYKQSNQPARCTSSGFHACINPLDIFQYYPPTSRFTEVTLSGGIHEDEEGDSKVAAQIITVGKELSLVDVCNLGVQYILQNTQSVETNTGDYSASTNTGDCSASTNTGDCSASTNTGYRSASINTGDYSASTNTGYRSASINTGDYSVSTNTGYYSVSTNTGNCSASTNTGDCSASTNTGYCSVSTNTGNCSASTNTGSRSASTNTGYYSASEVSGVGSLAVVTGVSSKARASAGSAIVLIHRNEDGSVARVVTGIAGVDIKADTWYTLDKNGNLLEEK